MKIVLVHNYYLTPGGEDQVFHAEVEVLRAHGNAVRIYTLHNSAIGSMSSLRLAASTVWNHQVVRDLTRLLQDDPPDIVHFHNTFPLISPAAYSAARRLRIPVVQTLHNYRLLCLNALFHRDERICEDCLGRMFPWPGVVHACYRKSHPASAVTAAMLGVHRLRGTWATGVDTYVALSEFGRAKLIAGGLPGDRIVVKPNFLSHDPGLGNHSDGYALYVGRLSPEKGVASLIQVWKRLALRVPLRIIGSGPLEHLVSQPSPYIEWLGWQTREHVLAAMQNASFLVFPSECYENFPMVLIEAMATGLPVLATNQGSVSEIVQDGSTGRLVRPGDDEHWSEVLEWAVCNPAGMAALGLRARQAFEAKYTAENGYRMLIQVYERTLSGSS